MIVLRYYNAHLCESDIIVFNLYQLENGKIIIVGENTYLSYTYVRQDKSDIFEILFSLLREGNYIFFVIHFLST